MCLGTGTAPQRMVTPKAARACLGNALRQRLGFLGCPVQGRELDLILEGFFQDGIFYDSFEASGFKSSGGSKREDLRV